MRKLCLSVVGLALFFSACKKGDKVAVAEEALPEIEKRSCAADDVLKAQMAADPAFAQRRTAIEAFTQRALASGETLRTTSGEMIVPVVVHFLYNKSHEIISDLQIQSQIDVLNEDYNLLNRDVSKIPSIFAAVKGNVGIRFQLAQTIRKYTAVTTWQTDDAMKYSAKGGSDVVDPDHKLNIWVCNLGGGILGYAQFPGGNPKTDGVVCGYFCFGRTGGKLEKDFNRGRTATHEVGHWMNLYHIWGSTYCGNDLVGDTPQATIYNFGCPAFPHYNQCRSNEIEMTMNYMDYTDDACMYMFTNGQKDRMLSVFLNGGPRAAFFQ